MKLVIISRDAEVVINNLQHRSRQLTVETTVTTDGGFCLSVSEIRICKTLFASIFVVKEKFNVLR